VRQVEEFHRVKADRNIAETTIIRKATCIGHAMSRKWLLKHVIAGNIREDESDVKTRNT
jgi:hypothetical protein